MTWANKQAWLSKSLFARACSAVPLLSSQRRRGKSSSCCGSRLVEALFTELHYPISKPRQLYSCGSCPVGLTAAAASCPAVTKDTRALGTFNKPMQEANSQSSSDSELFVLSA